MDRGLLFTTAVLAFLITSNYNTLVGGVLTSGFGLNYGTLGDNLPPPEQVIALLQSRNINQIRLFDPNPSILNALHNTNIQVILGVRNKHLQSIGSDLTAATDWINTNIIPHSSFVSFKYIVAGNEVIPGNLAAQVWPAMNNLDIALQNSSLPIPVTTAVATSVLGSSYPPSQGAFKEETAPVLAPIVDFLERRQFPLLVNVYPYFTYVQNKNVIALDYALFTSQVVPVVRDGILGYNNLFSAIVDAVYAALEKAGGPNVEIVVSETGWPSSGDDDVATVENARVYNSNALAHAACGEGTPRRPGKAIETYLFALFNEDLKGGGVEDHFGLYNPDMTEVYHVDFPVISKSVTSNAPQRKLGRKW